MQNKKTLLYCLSFTLGLLFTFTHTLATAQGIAIIKSHDIEPFHQALAGFLSACPGQVTEYDLRGSRRGEAGIIERIRAARPKLILAVGSLAAQVAKEGVRDIPVVFVMVPNPHKYGLKGEKIAGISLDIPSEMQFAMYKSLLPTLKTIGVIYDPEKTGAIVTEARVAAEKLGLQLLASPVTSQKGVPAALRSVLGKIDALWMVPDDTVMTPESFKFFLLAAFENNLPFIAVSDIFVEAGALVSLSPDYTDVGRQACQIVTDFEGGRMSLAEVNILPPAKIQLAINLKTALKIGLTFPTEIIQSASKVYR